MAASPCVMLLDAARCTCTSVSDVCMDHGQTSSNRQPPIESSCICQIWAEPRSRWGRAVIQSLFYYIESVYGITYDSPTTSLATGTCTPVPCERYSTTVVGK